MLAAQTVPTVYGGLGTVGIAFGENVKYLDEGALERVRAEMQIECERLGVNFRGGDKKTLTELAVELVFASKANTVIVPYHDILALGKEARINFPSTLSTENWSYRYLKEDFTPIVWVKLSILATLYKR